MRIRRTKSTYNSIAARRAYHARFDPYLFTLSGEGLAWGEAWESFWARELRMEVGVGVPVGVGVGEGVGVGGGTELPGVVEIYVVILTAEKNHMV